MPQKECGKRSSITFFRFRDAFGHFSVTFSDASVTFFRHFFAKLLLPNSFCGRVRALRKIGAESPLYLLKISVEIATEIAAISTRSDFKLLAG